MMFHFLYLLHTGHNVRQSENTQSQIHANDEDSLWLYYVFQLPLILVRSFSSALHFVLRQNGPNVLWEMFYKAELFL